MYQIIIFIAVHFEAIYHKVQAPQYTDPKSHKRLVPL